MSSGAFLLAASLLVQAAAPVEPEELIDHDGAHGWRCWAPVAIGRYEGRVWRDYGGELAHAAYQMQVELPDRDNPHTTSWAVDPRPEGPPKGKKPRWLSGLREADAFRNGPVSVLVELKWEPRAIVGPIRVEFWGDGAYAGSQVALNARKTRRYYATDRPAFKIAAYPATALIAKLASARTWTVVAVDGSGTRLASETFEVPAPKEAEAAFRAARARIDSLESRFIADHRPLEEGGAGCTDHEDPAATI